MFGRSSKGGVVGRPAKPGENPNRRAMPVTNPDPAKTRGGSKPRRTGKPAS